jgi:DNA polymerase I-like protein with 3'-5' exonuclease and polymerase domains
MGYDERVTREFFPDLWAARRTDAKVFDTMVGANVVYPDEHLAHLDYARLKVPGCTFPKALAGRFSLEAWGHRLGVHKGGYEGDFQTLTPEMLAYCAQDVAVTATLFQRLERRIKGGTFSWRAWNLEQRFKAVVIQQEKNGFGFDSAAADALTQRLQVERAELYDLLVAQFPPKVIHYVTPKQKKERTKTVPFNPNSDMQVVERLVGLGWKPTEWTAGSKRKDGKGMKPRPKLKDDELEHLSLPGAAELLRFARVTKRLEQLATGDAAWVKHVKADGRIHGRVKHNGAVTSRCTHSSPPIVGVPKVGKYLGKECRGLFIPGPGRVLVGVDISGLELRCLGHYLVPLDGGKYAQAVVRGDVHTVNREAFGIPDGTDEESKELQRDTAKRGIYALLYGAGDRKLGATIAKTPAQAKLAKAKFYKDTRVGRLVSDIAKQVARANGVLLPDGRLAWVRSQHAALNTLLQGSGAIIAKVAAVRARERFDELGLDALLVHSAHDENQYDVRVEHAEQVRLEAQDAVRWAGERLGIRCAMTAKSKIGKNWSETK